MCMKINFEITAKWLAIKWYSVCECISHYIPIRKIYANGQFWWWTKMFCMLFFHLSLQFIKYYKWNDRTNACIQSQKPLIGMHSRMWFVNEQIMHILGKEKNETTTMKKKTTHERSKIQLKIKFNVYVTRCVVASWMGVRKKHAEDKSLEIVLGMFNQNTQNISNNEYVHRPKEQQQHQHHHRFYVYARTKWKRREIHYLLCKASNTKNRTCCLCACCFDTLFISL